MSNALPVEGQWYRHRSDESFFVISVHEDDGCIDVRDADGDVDEFSLDEWQRMSVLPCDPPAQFSGDVTVVLPTESRYYLRQSASHK